MAKARPRTLVANRDDQDRLTLAEIGYRDHRYRLDVTRRIEGGVFTTTCRFHRDEQRFLEVIASIALPKEEFVRIAARSEAVSMSYGVDFSKYDQLHRGLVAGEINGMAIDGFIDPVAKRTSLNLSLSYWLEGSARYKLRAFVPLLNREIAQYEAQRDQYEDVIDATIGSSVWSTAGEAACWGFFTMLGGALGPPSGGLSATLFAIGASALLCQKLVEPLVKRVSRAVGGGEGTSAS